MRRRTFLARAAWLALAAAGCAGGKNSLFHEAHALDNEARLLREASAPPTGVGRELDKTPAEPYHVEPGDVLLVQPVELSSPLRLPGDQPVLPDGTIRLGRLGPLAVMGKTVEEVQAAVDERLKQANIEDKVSVRLITRDSKVYYVLGEVNAPGSFPLKGRETVLDVLLAAGGLNSNASRKNVILVRPTRAEEGCRAVLPVDYVAIVQRGDPTTNYQVRAGDRVYVPTRSMAEDLLHFCDKEPRRCTTTPCYPK